MNQTKTIIIQIHCKNQSGVPRTIFVIAVVCNAPQLAVCASKQHVALGLWLVRALADLCPADLVDRLTGERWNDRWMARRFVEVVDTNLC